MHRRGKVRRMLSIVVSTVAVCYLAIVALMWVFQEKMIYIPTRELSGNPASYGMQFEDVSFTATDGVKLHGWFVPAPEEKGVALFCHGNAGNVSNRVETLRVLYNLGVSTFVFDYRGYGRSEGSPTEQGTYRDVEAAWLYLTNVRKTPPGRITVFGRSLGGAIAAWIAKEHTPRALILESTFTSVPDMGRRLYPFLPVGLVARIIYPTETYVRDVRCPVLVAHSPDDEIVPYALGRGVFEAANEPKSFLDLQGSHNDGFLDSGTRYTEGLAKFIFGPETSRKE